MKSLEEVAVYLVSGLILAGICWLTKEVLELKKDMAKLQTEVTIKIADITNNCERHQRWAGDLQRSLGRLERNLIRLCTKQDVTCEEPEDGVSGFDSKG